MERIVQVGSLAAFCAEVPAAVLVGEHTNQVHLNLTERGGVTEGRLRIPYKDLELSLQGINARDEIVWLMWSYRFDFPDDEFMNRRGHSAYKLAPDVRIMVAAWLTDRGYEVLSGQYALPKDIPLLRGSFECVRFIQDGDEGYRLEFIP